MEVYTLEETAEKLKVAKSTVYNYLRSGQLKGTKIGRSWRISEEALDEFIRTGTQENYTQLICKMREQGLLKDDGAED